MLAWLDHLMPKLEGPAGGGWTTLNSTIPYKPRLVVNSSEEEAKVLNKPQVSHCTQLPDGMTETALTDDQD
jgi:hypothetical protein